MFFLIWRLGELSFSNDLFKQQKTSPPFHHSPTRRGRYRQNVAEMVAAALKQVEAEEKKNDTIKTAHAICFLIKWGKDNDD